VIRHAFEVLGLRGLFARHHPHNRGSGRILAKLGFRYTHDERMPQTGLDHPGYLLRARTREEHAG
jgi:RimJ/RimL family protein N-acetyltransferase